MSAWLVGSAFIEGGSHDFRYGLRSQASAGSDHHPRGRRGVASRPERHPAGLWLLGLGTADACGRGDAHRVGRSHLSGDHALGRVPQPALPRYAEPARPGTWRPLPSTLVAVVPRTNSFVSAGQLTVIGARGSPISGTPTGAHPRSVRDPLSARHGRSGGASIATPI